MRNPTREEFVELDGLNTEIDILASELKLKLSRLRRECGVPAYASLNESHHWVNSQGAPLVTPEFKMVEPDEE